MVIQDCTVKRDDDGAGSSYVRTALARSRSLVLNPPPHQFTLCLRVVASVVITFSAVIEDK